MKDYRMEMLVNKILDYSIKLKKGENLFVEINGEEGVPLALKIIKHAYEIGANPYYEILDYKIMREMLNNLTEEQVKIWANHSITKMKDADAYIGISACENRAELSKIPEDKMQIYNQYYLKPVHLEERVKNTKWCILKYPNNSIAQSSNMPLEEFEEFFYKSCNINYETMSKSMDKLVDLMNKTDMVHIISEGTDLTFSIKGIGAKKYVGNFNLPDGEVATAPVKDSVNGYITYNTESKYSGITMNNIKLIFENGKIITATSSETNKLNRILDTDDGARFIGEFALGLNPYIEKPFGDSLFDEKIKGSFHFTPGQSLEESDNGNRSAIHWDIVNIQTPEYGGGEIWFDKILVRKDGKFCLEELKELNAEI